MSFEERYKNGNTPWEINRADCNLVNMVLNTPIKPGKALDIGCGTGNNTIWLQQHGFAATGIDRIELAIKKAREKSGKAGVHCSFHLLDFMADTIPGVPFDFAFDRGCFHHFHEFGALDRFAEKTAGVLRNSGLWLTLTGNCDETREGPGPPQVSAGDIVNAVEPYFQILSLAAGNFDSNQEVPAKSWICLMMKR